MNQRMDAEQLRAIRSLREKFLSDPDHTSLDLLRPEVARSWQRSIACKVNPETPGIEILRPQVDAVLAAVASESLEDLKAILVDLGGAVALADAHGVLAWYAGDRSMLEKAEQTFPLSGTAMSEEYFGTNSDGVVLEEGKSVQIWGAEHFVGALQGSFCTSVPIRDPQRRSLRAILSIMLPEKLVLSSDPRSVLLTAQGAVSEIRAGLLERMESREHAILSEFVRESRKRGSQLVVAFDGKNNTIATEDAMWNLDRSDYGVLAGYAHESQQLGRPLSRQIHLADGKAVQLAVSPVELGSQSIGAVLRLKPVTDLQAKGTARAFSSTAQPIATLEPNRPRSPFKGILGKSHLLHDVLQTAAEACHPHTTPVILGEMGTGKTLIGLEIAGVRSVVYHTEDAGKIRSLGTLEEILSKYDPNDGILFDRAQNFDGEVFSALLECIDSDASRHFIFESRTMTGNLARLSERVRTVEVKLPPLRARREDIPLLLQHALDARRLDHYFSTQLMEVLTRGDWPGNITQLLAVLDGVVARAEGRRLDIKNLTTTEQKMFAKSRLSRLEEVELAQIRAALEEAKGNRVRAAEILEIGRSTLYRKIDRFSAKGFEFNF